MLECSEILIFERYFRDFLCTVIPLSDTSGFFFSGSDFILMFFCNGVCKSRSVAFFFFFEMLLLCLIECMSCKLDHSRALQVGVFSACLSAYVFIAK